MGLQQVVPVVDWPYHSLDRRLVTTDLFLVDTNSHPFAVWYGTLAGALDEVVAAPFAAEVCDLSNVAFDPRALAWADLGRLEEIQVKARTRGYSMVSDYVQEVGNGMATHYLIHRHYYRHYAYFDLDYVNQDFVHYLMAFHFQHQDLERLSSFFCTLIFDFGTKFLLVFELILN